MVDRGATDGCFCDALVFLSLKSIKKVLGENFKKDNDIRKMKFFVN